MPYNMRIILYSRLKYIFRLDLRESYQKSTIASGSVIFAQNFVRAFVGVPKWNMGLSGSARFV